MKPNRLLRVDELLKRELGALLTSGSGEYMVTVTEVRVSRDLSYADVWVSILGEPEVRTAGLSKLKSEAWRLRHTLAGRVYLRKMPLLRFFFDETLDRAERIDRALKASGIQTDEQDYHTE
ncbi:MAG: 30S ribosome-binding factor RbfA [Calditrichaeota bacterium]|nr:30S ribosome-binding factor RbfA [Calditrichota bacterium]